MLSVDMRKAANVLRPGGVNIFVTMLVNTFARSKVPRLNGNCALLMHVEAVLFAGTQKNSFCIFFERGAHGPANGQFVSFRIRTVEIVAGRLGYFQFFQEKMLENLQDLPPQVEEIIGGVHINTLFSPYHRSNLRGLYRTPLVSKANFRLSLRAQG